MSSNRLACVMSAQKNSVPSHRQRMILNICASGGLCMSRAIVD